MQVSPSISTLRASNAPMQCQSGFCIQPSSVLGSCGSVVDDGSAAQNLYVLHLPQVQAAEEVGAGGQVISFAAPRIEASVMNPRLKSVNLRAVRRWRRRRAGKEKQHMGVVEEVAGPRDGELGRRSEPEADGLALPRGAQAQPPGLDIDAAIPEARLGCGNGYVHGAGDVKADEFIARGRVGHVYRLAVHADGKGGGTHLRGHRRGLNAGGGMDGGRKNENGHEQRTKTHQEDGPRQEIRTKLL